MVDNPDPDSLDPNANLYDDLLAIIDTLLLEKKRMGELIDWQETQLGHLYRVLHERNDPKYYMKEN
jgi:hypothetical protein